MQETVKSILRKASKKRTSRSEVSTNQDLSARQASAEEPNSRSLDLQDRQISHDYHPTSTSRSRPLITINTDQAVDASQRHTSDSTHSYVDTRPLESQPADVTSALDPQVLADDLTGLSMDERTWCLYEENVADRNIELYGIPPPSDDISVGTQGWPLQDNNSSPRKDQKKHSIAHDLLGPSPTVTSSDPVEQSRSSSDRDTKSSRHHSPSYEHGSSSIIETSPVCRKDHATSTRSSSTFPDFPSSSVHSQHHVRSDSAMSHQARDKLSQSKWKEQRRDLLDGVVDLENCIDTDKEVKRAPAVTHEVVKPHEHEIIEPKIYREIHNYTYHHRILPVIQTEVLPPKHFIPNPNGEGLIEISESQIPSRTTYRRTWDLLPKDITPSTVEQTRWRTKPEIIEGETTITAEGFERKNTTILHPHTIADMREYGGLVQPVHFDHATGRSWLGDLTTVRKLEEQYPDAMKSDAQELKSTSKSDGNSLHQVRSRHSIHRKPVPSNNFISV